MAEEQVRYVGYRVPIIAQPTEGHGDEFGPRSTSDPNIEATTTKDGALQGQNNNRFRSWRPKYDYTGVDPTPFFMPFNKSGIPNIPNAGYNRALAPGTPLCGAKNRAFNRPCYGAARTNGRCTRHGGREFDPNIIDEKMRLMQTVGRYDTGRVSGKLLRDYRHFLIDNNLLSLADEIALLRARLQSVIISANRRDGSANASGKPVDAVWRKEKWDEARGLINDIASAVKLEMVRVKDSQKTLTEREARAVVAILQESIITHVKDPSARRAIQGDLVRKLGRFTDELAPRPPHDAEHEPVESTAVALVEDDRRPDEFDPA